MNSPTPPPQVPVEKPPRVPTTRRNFLIGTGAVAGLAVGFALWPRSRALNWAAGKDETVINGFVKIGTDGRVVVAVPQAEMGQGVFTSLPQILADELGADWNTVSVEPAPLHPLYANRGIALDPTAEMPTFFRGFARWTAGKVVEHYDLQSTGGSTSVRGFAQPVRLAGAAAREMLCCAAARDWGVDWTECDTDNGFVIYKAKRVRFADIAGKAAAEDMPSAPVLREPGRGKLMGKSVQRIDIPGKTDGSARFGIDVRLPGMVYAAVKSGPAGDPKLLHVDTRAVLTTPGVIDVVHGPSWVAVVASTWYGAHAALETLSPVFASAAKPAGPWIEPALKTALNADVDAGTVQKAGDAAALLGQVGMIHADYTVPFLAHAALEPMNATARFDSGHCEVWAPTQSLSMATWSVAKALGVDAAAVTVHPTLLGGGFGRKAESDACMQAALIARVVKRPVQLIWSREEDFAQDRFRPAAAARMRAALSPRRGDRPARITAWASRVAVPDAAVSFMSRNLPALAGTVKPNAAAVEGSVGPPYDFGAMLAEHVPVETQVPLGFWRSVGHSFTAFFVESFVDECAHAAGVDPGAFRLAMLQGSPRHAAVLRAALDAAGPLGVIEPNVARGVALHESFGSVVAEVAEVVCKSGEDPHVRRVVAAIDCGPVVNPDGVRSQIEGGILFGLGAALKGRISFEHGRTEQVNFDTAPMLTLAEAPAITVIIVPSSAPMGGVGEPGTPPIAPAVANAIFAATGQRHRDLPLIKQV